MVEETEAERRGSEADKSSNFTNMNRNLNVLEVGEAQIARKA
jgi:hypothetical protein